MTTDYYMATTARTTSETSTSSTWRVWCDGTATATSTWTAWVAYDSGTTASTTTAWTSWHYVHSVSERRQESAREREARLERQRQQQAKADEFRAEQRRKEVEREARAKELLQSLLDTEQSADLAAKGEFILTSVTTGNRYRVKTGRAGNVERIDESGKAIERLCFHPRENVHNYDTMAAQTLMLENDEGEARKVANITRLAATG